MLLWCAGSVYTNAPETAVLLGLVRRVTMFSPLAELKLQTDFQ